MTDLLSNQGCNHTTFFQMSLNTDELCRIAQSSNCDENYTFANFYSFTYCDLNGSWIGFLPIGFLVVFIIFRFIGNVVEEYLAPAITYMTEWFNLSEAMGAVTLLALANGAGDVVTAIVASTSPQGISYNIGSLYGAGLFVTTIVVGFTIINSGDVGVQLVASSIYRDVGMYIIATLLIIAFGIVGNLNMVNGIMLLSLYAILVLIVFVEEKFFKQKENQAAEDSEQSLQTLLSSKNSDELDEEKPKETAQQEQPKTRLHGLKKFKATVRKVQIMNITVKAYHITQIKIQRRKEKLAAELSFVAMPIQDKIFWVLDLPFVYAKKLTITPAEEDQYTKIWASIAITPGLILMTMILTNSLGWYQLYAVLPIGLVLSVAVFFTSPDDTIPRYYILLQVFAVLSTLVWTYFVSGCLIDLLNFVGMLTNLSKTYLGLTVIAMGNALPDAVTTIALSKQGLALMGMTGAFAGQLFGLLVGLGLALITLNTSPSYNQLYPNGKDFQLFEWSNIIELIVLFTILITLSVTFVYGVANKFLFERGLANILIIIYVVMFVTVTIIAIIEAVNNS